MNVKRLHFSSFHHLLWNLQGDSHSVPTDRVGSHVEPLNVWFTLQLHAAHASGCVTFLTEIAFFVRAKVMEFKIAPLRRTSNDL